MIVYHRTSTENAELIIKSGIMKSCEYALFFGNEKQGYIGGYGKSVISFEIPEKLLEVDDEFETGEKHFRLPLTKSFCNVSQFLPKMEENTK